MLGPIPYLAPPPPAPLTMMPPAGPPVYRSKNAPKRIMRPAEYYSMMALPAPGYDFQYLEPPRPVYVEESSDDDRDRGKRSEPVYILDMIGQKHKLTVRGHVKLLRALPLRREMNLKLIDTFRKRPGNYEARDSYDRKNVSKVYDLKNGYISLELSDDLSLPEMNEFLLGKEWTLLTASQDADRAYEKWTNKLQH